MIFLKDRLPMPVRRAGRQVRDELNVVRRYRTAKFKYAMVQHMKAVIKRFEIDSVLDVGANEGQFGSFLRREVGYKRQIISLEPVSSTFEKLAAAARSDPAWNALNTAAGSAPGRLDINITRDSVFNSFRSPKDDNLFSSVNQMVATEEVEVCRLDALPGMDRFKSIFLKVDTQGFDLDVIRGASGLLGRVSAIQTEVSFIPIYDEVARFDDVFRELDRLGFAVSNMFPVTLADLQAVEFDCILVKKGASSSLPYSYERVILEA